MSKGLGPTQRQVLDYLTAHAADIVTLKELAAHAGFEDEDGPYVTWSRRFELEIPAGKKIADATLIKKLLASEKIVQHMDIPHARLENIRRACNSLAVRGLAVIEPGSDAGDYGDFTGEFVVMLDEDTDLAPPPEPAPEPAPADDVTDRVKALRVLAREHGMGISQTRPETVRMSGSKPFFLTGSSFGKKIGFDSLDGPGGLESTINAEIKEQARRAATANDAEFGSASPPERKIKLPKPKSKRHSDHRWDATIAALDAAGTHVPGMDLLRFRNTGYTHITFLREQAADLGFKLLGPQRTGPKYVLHMAGRS